MGRLLLVATGSYRPDAVSDGRLSSRMQTMVRPNASCWSVGMQIGGKVEYSSTVSTGYELLPQMVKIRFNSHESYLHSIKLLELKVSHITYLE